MRHPRLLVVVVEIEHGANRILVRVSYLAMHMEGHLAELDINPLMVLPSGQGVRAVDALVVLRAA